MDDEAAIRAERAVRKEDSRILNREVLKRPISDLKPRAPVTVERGTVAATAIETMRRHNIGCVLVVDHGILAGIFTERDLLRKLAGTNVDPRTTPIDKVMTPKPETLRLGDRVVFAFNKMCVGGFRHLPLIDEAGRPVGVISVKDLIRFLVEFFPGEIMNVPPDPDRRIPPNAEGG
ncbi:MAG TPA: CBS domain-containing protein [Planctomycetota bacterium]|nr:CBS domain-containing protein [Planctomycetota bacterium]